MIEEPGSPGFFFPQDAGAKLLDGFVGGDCGAGPADSLLKHIGIEVDFGLSGLVCRQKRP